MIGRIEGKSIGIVEMVDLGMHVIERGDTMIEAHPIEVHRQRIDVIPGDTVVEILLVMQTAAEFGTGMMIGIVIGTEKEIFEMHHVEMTILPNNVGVEDWDIMNDHGGIGNYHGIEIVVVVVWEGREDVLAMK